MIAKRSIGREQLILVHLRDLPSQSSEVTNVLVVRGREAYSIIPEDQEQA
jgi:hypothetical protein